QNGLLYLLLEARTERLVDIATDRELIVRERWCYPDHGHAAFIDVARLLLDLVHRVVHGADLIGARLHELKSARVITREADPTEDLGRAFAREMFANEILGHDSPGGRGARAEQERLARDSRRKLA